MRWRWRGILDHRTTPRRTTPRPVNLPLSRIMMRCWRLPTPRLLSPPPRFQTTPACTFTDAEKKAMSEKIQNAGTVVVEAKAGKGSATLSMVGGSQRGGAGPRGRLCMLPLGQVH